MSKAAQFSWLVAAMVFSAGCDRYRRPDQVDSRESARPTETEQEHSHRDVAAAGIIATLGRDEYHVEAIVQTDKRLAIYLLAADETRIQEVEEQRLTGYIKTGSAHPTAENDPGSTVGSTAGNQVTHRGGETAVILFRPDPLPGDSTGKTSRFVGELPQRSESQTQVARQTMQITLPGLRIDGERFVVRFEIPPTTPETIPVSMPRAIDDDQAGELYLSPGGLYSQADIEANGGITAGEKYRDFRPQHDTNPAPGARLCPITQTKANSQCSWIINGERYEFCCPPCIDEFLEMAKSDPEKIQPAASYLKEK